MTNHSNPITDILEAFEAGRRFDGDTGIDYTAKTLHALYEAVAPVIGQNEPQHADYSSAVLLAVVNRNDLRNEQRQKLRALFEVDLGASEKPTIGNKPSGKQVDTRSEQLIPQSEIDAELEATAKIEKKFRDGELR